MTTPLIDVTHADTYFTERLFAQTWENADDLLKNKALIQATKIIERLSIVEYDEAPDDILDACCEIAYALLDGVDPDKEFENLAMESSTYGGVRSTYNRSIQMEHIEAGVPSVVAWRLLKPYIDVSKTVKMSRVS
jgi:hypothetical protein